MTTRPASAADAPDKLLADGDGYKWVDRNDPALNGTYALRTTGTVGDPSEGNLVVEGEALAALRSLGLCAGQVKLCYVDPPYNTGKHRGSYDDNLSDSAWSAMMRDRLETIRPLLTADGSIWVHLDDKGAHRCRPILDEVFGDDNYVGTVIWEKKKKGSFGHSLLASVTEPILVYAADRNRLAPFTFGVSEADKLTPFHNAGNGTSTLRFPAGSVTFNIADGTVGAGDMSTDSIVTALLDPVRIVNGKNVEAFAMTGEWRYNQASLDQFVANGEMIRVARTPFRPNRVRTHRAAKRLTNLWSFRINGVPTNEDGTAELKALGLGNFGTPKPEGLLHRIITSATSPGDLVLDCFAGSGTTAAVAQKLGRRWVVVERNPETVQRVIVPRLTQVVNGERPDSDLTPKPPLPACVRASEVRAAIRVLRAYESVGALLAETIDELVEVLDAPASAPSPRTGGGFTVAELTPSQAP